MRPACLAALLAITASAASAPSIADPPARPCAAPEYHVLDFWLGDWRIETGKGRPAGASRIEPALGGCVLIERWSGLTQEGDAIQAGLGVHRYDMSSGLWRHGWVDEGGTAVDLAGRPDGRALVYEGAERPDTPKSRMTLTPLADGGVEQKGENWDAATSAWKTTFRLIYRRARGDEPTLPAVHAPSDCSAAGYRALDFWVGDWDVAAGANTHAGRNRVESVLGGCALLEQWEDLSEPGTVHSGIGLHRFDAPTGLWRQAWVMDDGSTYDMQAKPGPTIVYDRVTPAGPVLQRTTLAPLPGGRVDQFGERRADAGAAWREAFHLVYSRR